MELIENMEMLNNADLMGLWMGMKNVDTGGRGADQRRPLAQHPHH